MASLLPGCRTMSVSEIINELAARRYQPPISSLCDDMRSIPDVLRIPILISDFDTEVQMNGMLGFLENFGGRYLVDTIEALGTISAHKTADTLRAILRIMSEHGVSVEQLRGDLAKVQELQVTSFADLHGERLADMTQQIDAEARKLYVYQRDGEAVFDLLEANLQQRRDELLAALEACAGLDGSRGVP
jgi:Domain of unknown function (DUF4375)